MLSLEKHTYLHTLASVFWVFIEFRRTTINHRVRMLRINGRKLP